MADRILVTIIAGVQFVLSFSLLVGSLFALGYGAASVGAFNPFWLLLALAGLVGAYFVERAPVWGRILGALWHGALLVAGLSLDRSGLHGSLLAIISYAGVALLYLAVTGAIHLRTSASS